MDSIAIVDYGAGNHASVKNAFDSLGVKSFVTSSPEQVRTAKRLVFPGVGAAASAMENLQKTGLGEALKMVVQGGYPVLGICLGCQIVLDSSEENEGTECLGLLAGSAKRFLPEPGKKIPHMGWNQMVYAKPHALWNGIPDGSDFYFVHSYYPSVTEREGYAKTTYGTQEFDSAVGKDNLIATQCHLEKSGPVGLAALKNFSEWNP
jgi:glutamine amidotransferase